MQQPAQIDNLTPEKILFVVSVNFFNHFVFSQTNYTSGNYANVRDSIHLNTAVSSLQSHNFDSTAANISWGFSGLALSSQSDEKMDCSYRRRI
jgi:hypothetical protein